ncbi:hypothetical protein BED21_13010 [Escherichia coli]|nr:hypothetical protein AB62_4701 [Escherichia coli 2-210-07_S1_C3]KDW88051.1 hypothetical protein AB30_4623 [Escherichia coli 2-210-07_S1_C2]MCH6933193.1 hypothetical protein [Escherichia coli]
MEEYRFAVILKRSYRKLPDNNSRSFLTLFNVSNLHEIALISSAGMPAVDFPLRKNFSNRLSLNEWIIFSSVTK